MFIYMLTEAAHKPSRFGTVDLQRGQLVSGRHKLAEHLALSERSVRTCLQHLHDLGMITSQSTNRFTVYTIVNYGQYQDNTQPTDQPIDQQATSYRPTSDQLPTTIQEAKNERIKEKNKYIPPISGELLTDWLKVRKAKRSGELTETAFKGLQREARLAGLSDEEAVKVCCERSWQSFTAEWYLKKPSVSQNVQQARLTVAEQIMGGRNGTKRQIIDINQRPAIENYGESLSETSAGVWESDASKVAGH